MSLNLEIEYILDFHSLITCSSITNGYLVIHYQCKYDIENTSLEYCLRTSIRQLGYKITYKKNYFDDEEISMISYGTNIPENISSQYSDIWNKYHICEEIYE